MQLPTLHALLIGIDGYRPNRLYKSLRGAVGDINLIESFLRQTLQVPPECIYRLTSANQDDPALLAPRAKDIEPTYENIVSAFDQITKTAQPGEQVYVHYSGHGGRAVTAYPLLKQGIEQSNESIVPMDIGDTAAGRYLRDVEIATLLKRMTDKGLIVTVVLDSCHSGGATRGDAEIRSSHEPDRLARTSESLVASREELERNWLVETQRFELGAGLPQTRQYVLLAACRPNEYAYEYSPSEKGQKHGALTYWMIDTLRRAAASGQPLTYKLLHDRVNAQVQSKFAQQIPMISGECDRLVFGSDRWATPFTASVISVLSETRVRLNAGQAQGISTGTHFSIFPLNTADFTDKARRVATVEVASVEASESAAKVLSVEEGGIEGDRKIEPGAPAVLVSAPVELVQRVRLMDDKVAGEQEGELPSALAIVQKEELGKVRQALVGNSWIVEEKVGESALYQVAIDQQGNYEICKGAPVPNLRPILSINDLSAPQRVVDRLVHLAKYQAVQSLSNPGSALSRALKVELLSQDKKSFPNPENIAVISEEIVCLRLVNEGDRPLKVAVLDIEPNWAVSQIAVDGIESPFFALDRGEVKDILLRLKVPDNEAYEQSQEIIKVFAVRKGLADFRWLTLPALDEPPKPSNAEADEALLASRSFTKKGALEEISPLNDLLKLIGSDRDKAHNALRSVSVVVDPTQEWIAKQVQITVKRQ